MDRERQMDRDRFNKCYKALNVKKVHCLETLHHCSVPCTLYVLSEILGIVQVFSIINCQNKSVNKNCFTSSPIRTSCFKCNQGLIVRVIVLISVTFPLHKLVPFILNSTVSLFLDLFILHIPVNKTLALSLDYFLPARLSCSSLLY